MVAEEPSCRLCRDDVYHATTAPPWRRTLDTSRPFHDSPLTNEQLEAHRSRLEDIIGAADVIEDVYRLSPLQEAMYFHAVASDAEDLYVIQQRLEIEGPLDPVAFQDAWSRVVAHHPALRSVFVWDGSGEPAQIVCRGIDVEVEFTDLTGSTDAQERTSAIEAAIETDRRTRFLLDAPPVMRLLLFKVAADLHELVWSQHHLTEDGWSATFVLQQVFGAYEKLIAGETPELPPSRPYGDYIRWLAERDGEATAAFWRDHFAGFSAPTRLSTVPVGDETSEYVRISHSLGRELSDRLRTFARQQRLTLNTMLVGGMTLLLGRYVGRADVALGVVASGRPYTLSGVESMVGMFINTLPLRVPIDPEASAASWLREVQNRQADVIEHEYTPLPSVQSWTDLGPGVTLTDTLFAFWGFGGADMSDGHTLKYRTTAGYGRTSFPVSFTVEATDVISVEMDFDAAGFDQSLGPKLLEHYATLLESIVTEPDHSVRSLDMLTESERNTVEQWNATESPLPYDTVVAAFRATANHVPDAVAIRMGDREVRYQELDRLARAVADGVRAHSGESVGRVGIHMARSPEMIAAILGVLMVGGSYVPMDRHHPRGRVNFVLEDCGAEMVLTDATSSGDYAVTELRVDALTTASAETLATPIGDAEAYVMYTSGSTGTPKGVMISHHNLANYVSWAHHQYGDGAATSFALHTSPSFDLTVTSMFVPLVSGGTIVVYPDESARDLSVVDVFDDDLVDVVKLTPSHLALLDVGLLDTNRIRALVVGGEDFPTELARSVTASNPRLVLYNEYGPTEATVGCMIHRFNPETDVGTSVPIGAPIANTQMFVFDETLADVPTGFAGDLYVAGAGVAKGYLGRDDLTAATFMNQPGTGRPMYRTGDRAKRTPGGGLEFLGRADDQMKLRGFRIEPGEIEAVLGRHEAVATSAVAIREPHPGDERLVAYFVPASGATPNVTALREHLAAHLPEYMTPQHLVRVDELPLTTNGKLDRASLPDTIGDVTRTVGFRAPVGSREELVADVAAELLGTDRVSMRDNFFDLGGHSILAMQFIARLNTETGHRLSPRVLLLNTLEQAAAALPESIDESITDAEASSTSDVASQTIGTSAYFFGPSDSPLFGIHYAPAGGTPRSKAVLICPPIGWEYMRTHWTSRKVARLLVQAGYHVLRFDYFATGDSAGDSVDGDVDRWLADVASAAAELRSVSGVERITAVGIRHGATFAALAAADGAEIDQLIMWDPVVDGRHYLHALEAMHAEMLETRGGPRVPIETSGDELLGTPYPPALRASLSSIDLGSNGSIGTPGVVISSHVDQRHRLLTDASGGRLTHEIIEDAGGWSDLGSAQAALLPTRIPARIAALLDER